MSFVDEFDWDAYSTSSSSRFIEKDVHAFSSSGAENTLFILSMFFLLFWICRVFTQIYSILISTKYLHIQKRAIHLHGMSKWVGELKRLNKSHFNQILRIKRPVPPLFLSRVRMLVDLKPKTAKIVSDINGDNVVEFKFDCKRTCYITAHWGVPFDILDSVIGSDDDHCSITIDDEPSFSTNRLSPTNIFLKAFFPRFDNKLDSLLVNESDSLSDCSKNSRKCGDMSLFSSDRNLDVSSEPMCFNPGNDYVVQLKPSSIGLEHIAQISSTHTDGLQGNKIIGLVVVLYVPKDHENRVFTSGNIDTYNSYAQVTTIKIKPKTSFKMKNDDGNELQLSCDIGRQLIFTCGIGPHEPKDMFGMGDENDKECLICLAKEMNTLLLPCCHSSFCSSCIKSLRQEKCPICRTNFSSYVSFNLKND